jgi:excisionase family DNA binding protein
MPRLTGMTITPAPDEWMTTDQAARYLGVSVSTLLRWEAEDSRLAARRTRGGHRRFLRSDLDTYMQTTA